MAANPRVSKMPPKKLQPSKWPFPVSGTGSGAAVLGVGVGEVVVVVVGAAVVVVVVVVVVVSGVGVIVVVVVTVVVLVVVVVVVVVLVVVSEVVVSGGAVVVVVVVGSGSGAGSSPEEGQDSISLITVGLTESSVILLSNSQTSDVSLYFTNTHPSTARQASQSASALHDGGAEVVDVVLAGVVLGGVEGGRAQTWQPMTNPRRRYPSMLMRKSCVSVTALLSEYEPALPASHLTTCLVHTVVSATAHNWFCCLSGLGLGLCNLL